MTNFNERLYEIIDKHRHYQYFSMGHHSRGCRVYSLAAGHETPLVVPDGSCDAASYAPRHQYPVSVIYFLGGACLPH